MASETEYDVSNLIPGLIDKYRPKPDVNTLEEQRKIARGNSIAEAFRLIIDAAGGSKGADIVPRNINDPVNKAVDKYNSVRDTNRKEQQSWDQLKLGQELKAIDTQSQNRFTEQQRVRKENFDINKILEENKQKEEDRKLQRETNEVNDRRYELLYGNQAAAKKEDQKIEREKLAIEREKLSTASENKSFEKSYANGTFKGFSITDEKAGRTFGLPTVNIPTALAFMQKDPGVQDEIGVIKARFDQLGTSAEVNSMIAKAFSKLSPETQNKLWALSSGSVPFNPQTVNSQPQGQIPGDFQFYKNTPQAPTIKTDKKSTIVQVQQPASEQQGEDLSPENISKISQIQSDPKLPNRDKGILIYQYLVSDGYDVVGVQEYVEGLYPELKVEVK